MIRSIRNRIALWHVLMFMAMSLVSFFMIYQLMDRFLLQRTDELLIERVKRTEWYGKDELQVTISGNIDYWMRIEGAQSVFYVVFLPSGKIFAAPSCERWKRFEIDYNLIYTLVASKRTGPSSVKDAVSDLEIHELKGCPGMSHVFFHTRIVESQNYRICYSRLKDGKVYLCAQSLKQNEEFLGDLRQVFWLLFGIMILLGGGAGFFLARKSVSGVKKVTKIAREIELGNFESRLMAVDDGIEIEELAERFNSMLDKIQMLLTTLSGIGDDIAHDLRTPITRIRGTAEEVLMREKNEISHYETALCSVIEECDNLVVMINTMLEISQTDSGLVELQPEKVDLWDVLEAGYELFRPMAEDKGITIDFQHDTGDATLKIHLNKIQRALSNLIDNAIKFTSNGGSIQISGQSFQDYLLIHVKDTGIGIPKEEQNRIFERFYRSDPSRSIEGNGLGLCLAKVIVEAHRGELLIESTPGSGSTFTIKLPRS